MRTDAYNRHLSLVPLVTLGLLVVFCPGCGQSDDGKVHVAGQVTFNGTPVDQGEIRFVIEGHSAEASRIEAGSYSVNVPPGTADIQIVAYRPQMSNGQPSMTGTAPIMENYIPAKYNEKSQLTADVSKSQSNLNFDLAP